MRKFVWFIGVIVSSVFLGLSVAPVLQAQLFDAETLVVPPLTHELLQFGSSVDISGNSFIIGAPFPLLPQAEGSVIIYTINGANEPRQTVLQQPGNPGTSVAIDGNLAIAGVPNRTASGFAAIFAQTGGVWTVQAQVSANDKSDGDGFGTSVAIDGTTVVVSRDCQPGGTNCDLASYVFVQSGTNWIQQAKLASAGPVAISGDTILAGTNVYVRNGAVWTLQQVLPVSGVVAVSVDGDNALLGTGSGPADLFVRSGGTWTFQQQLAPTNFIGGPFGVSVDIKNTRAIIGGGQIAVVFDRVAGSWILSQQLTPFATPDIDPIGFGNAVAIDGNSAIVGASSSDSPSHRISAVGAAYLFTTTAAPTNLVVAASPNLLFPPNHRLVPVTINVENHDAFSSCRIVSVSSTEPRKKNAGAPDWIITGDLTLLLRAERSGTEKNGRVYTITVECVDAFGNTFRNNAFVTVPHNRGK